MNSRLLKGLKAWLLGCVLGAGALLLPLPGSAYAADASLFDDHPAVCACDWWKPRSDPVAGQLAVACDPEAPEHDDFLVQTRVGSPALRPFSIPVARAPPRF
ncbi:MAG TPA: hypothetical protein VIS76_09760 [Pseudomonadales bacterium]